MYWVFRHFISSPTRILTRLPHLMRSMHRFSAKQMRDDPWGLFRNISLAVLTPWKKLYVNAKQCTKQYFWTKICCNLSKMYRVKVCDVMRLSNRTEFFHDAMVWLFYYCRSRFIRIFFFITIVMLYESRHVWLTLRA